MCIYVTIHLVVVPGTTAKTPTASQTAEATASSGAAPEAPAPAGTSRTTKTLV
ncbi:exported protein of unknown function [Ruminococcaceae bacterium BL-6]|nr:exported protein of unknown function [Ruminococcaceae bacterium BL-6]